MAKYPRRVTRGILKGQEFSSESEYRKAYQKATGTTRYTQRKKRAQELGYTGYTERRRKLRELKEKGVEIPDVKTIRDVFEREANNYSKRTREDRIRALSEEARRLDVSPFEVYSRFYQVIDARGMRANERQA